MAAIVDRLRRSRIDPGIVLGDATPVADEQGGASAVGGWLPDISPAINVVAAKPPLRGVKLGLMRLSACDTDRHLIDAITADRDRLEQVNDGLRARVAELELTVRALGSVIAHAAGQDTGVGEHGAEAGAA